MWFKKIKFRKLQYILMMIILVAAAMIFSESLAYVQEVNAIVSDFYSEKNMPGIVIMSKGGSFERITADDTIMRDVQKATLYGGKTDSDVVEHNGKTLKGGFVVMPIENRNELIYTLSLKNKNNTDISPAAGEMWLPFTFADQNGIKIGDTLTLGNKGTYKISEFTFSTTTATVFSQFAPFYVGSADFEKFQACQNYELIFIDAKDGIDLNDLFISASEISNELLEGGGTRESLATNDSLSTNITGNVATAAALIMFVAALFIMAYIIRNNLQKEMSSIGIYKAMGFSNAKIKGIYFKSYLFTGIVASVVGVIAGLPLIYASGAPAVKYIGGFAITGISAVCGIISVAILALMIIACLLITLKKIDKIKPVETLNLGMRSGAKKLKKSVIKSAHSPLSVAVNEIFKTPVSSVLTCLMIAVAVLLSYIFGSIGHSMSFMDTKVGAYFNFPEGDAYIMDVYKNSDPNLCQKIKDREEVQAVIMSEMSFRNVKINGKTLGVNLYKYDTFQPNLTGIPYGKGREPRNDSEIALTPYLLKLLSLKVNDYVKIDADGKGEKSVLITGSYSALVGASNSMQMLLTDKSEENIQAYISVHLKNGESVDAFKKSVEGEFANTFVYKKFPYIDKMAEMVYGIVKAPVNITIAIFLGFATLIIINMLFMNYIDGRKSFGTLKALGFTTKYIALKNLFKMLLLTVAGTVAGLCAGMLAAPLLYGLIFGKGAFVFSAALPFVIFGILLAIVVGATLFFALPINKIKSKELMEV